MVALMSVAGACASGDRGSASPPSSAAPTTTSAAGTTTQTAPATAGTTQAASAPAGQGAPRSFKAEVWADNWFSLYVNGALVGQDTVPITTERSFNSETIPFAASYPFTIAMITKDYAENDTGLEYIGTGRQQMGDGGFIAQITDTSTGEVVAVTGTDWRGLLVQRAPLDPSCEKSSNPTVDCTFERVPEPEGWAATSFDDSAWVAATVHTADEVRPQGDYATITWDPAASLIWTSSLKQDNTILWRHTVEAP